MLSGRLYGGSVVFRGQVQEPPQLPQLTLKVGVAPDPTWDPGGSDGGHVEWHFANVAGRTCTVRSLESPVHDNN